MDAFWSLFMKMQVSVKEATDCLKKMIGGSQMGNWFENMEAMNIQEERAKTKAAEENLAKAEEKLGEAETSVNFIVHSLIINLCQTLMSWQWLMVIASVR